MNTIDHALHNLIVDKLDIEYDVPNINLQAAYIV